MSHKSIKNSHKTGKTGFTVQLESGVWLSEGLSALDRTLVLSNAAIFESTKLAQRALNRARELRTLPHARIEVFNQNSSSCLMENEPFNQSDFHKLPAPGKP